MIIYCITNKLNGKQYVGQTINNLDYRYKQHCRCNRSYIGRVIKKHGKENFNIEEIDNAMFIEDLNLKEQHWISKLGTMKPNGYNLCVGGDNTYGYQHTEDARRKMSLTKRQSEKMKGKNNHFYGKKHSEETKKKMSDAWKSGKRVLTPEHQKKLKDAHRTRKVKNVDTGEVFNSTKEASEKYGIHATHITRVCRGRRKTTGGYKWEYIE